MRCHTKERVSRPVAGKANVINMKVLITIVPESPMVGLTWGKNTNSQRNQSRKTDANGLTAEERAVLKRDREWRERNGY